MWARSEASGLARAAGAAEQREERRRATRRGRFASRPLRLFVMGKVVKLEPASRNRSKSERPCAPAEWAAGPPTTAANAARRDKTALVLGGGGFTGGMYEIGALRALDLLAVNATVTDFDVYVGTSAGAFIAALTANGVTPEEMMRVATRQKPLPFKDIDLGDLLKPNLGELARSARDRTHEAALERPPAGPPARARVDDGRRRSSLVDVLPVRALQRRGDRALPAQSALRTRAHRRLRRARRASSYLTATDLDTCERVVFGVEKRSSIPISRAARASGALPMVYAPVKVGDREMIDGGIVSTTNVDLAVQAGAKMIVVINPLVPYINDFSSDVRTMRRQPSAARLGHGLRADRLPDVQARRPPAAARTRQDLGEPLPGCRHHADRVHALVALVAVDRQRSCHMQRLPAMLGQRVAEFLSDRSNAMPFTIAPSPDLNRSRKCACPTSSA